MKQKYIVDDIVMYKNRIHTIIDTLGSNNYELSYIRHSVNQAELSGVPLTHEILEKNGWNKGQIYFTHSRIPRIKLCTDEYEFKWSVSINGDIMGGYICYAHDLQHILFAFEINSEMEVQK